MKFSSHPKTPGETSYIVRLYRSSSTTGNDRDPHDSISLAGVVVRTDDGGRASFRNIEELWRILAGVVPFTYSDHSSSREES